MSADDLRGLLARVHRSDVVVSARAKLRTAPRRSWLRSFLVVFFVGVPLAWTGQDPADRAAAVESAFVEAARPALPLEINARVERWLEAFRTTRRPELERMLARRGLYADMIVGELRERGMPEELLYMAVIESGLKPHAVSRVSAVGMWQFMSPTAAQYGLRVDEYVDERRDPVRATEAALDYLEYLHGRFGSWYLAAAAFNAGPGRVERILNLHVDGRIGEEAVYWEVLDHLPRETREYVPKLLAVTILARDADAVGLAESFEPYRYDTVLVPGSTSLRTIARAIDVDVEVLRTLNPHLRRDVTPPNEGYGVRVPVGESARVVSSLALAPWERSADD